MKSLELKANLRKETGKKSTVELRNQGFVPCVMYGGKENILFSVRLNDLHPIIYTHNVYLIKMNLDGQQYNVILKDIQFHPVTDEPVHLDFVEVSENKPAVVSLPVTLTGSSIGLREGGKLRQRRRYLTVKGMLKDLPETLDIDITDVNIGKFLKVGDLKYPNLELLDPARDMVVGVATSRIAKGMEEGVPVGAIIEEAEEAEEEEAGAKEEKGEKVEKGEKAEAGDKSKKPEKPEEKE
jgi:large subunit ribosomal protein L25